MKKFEIVFGKGSDKMVVKDNGNSIVDVLLKLKEAFWSVDKVTSVKEIESADETSKKETESNNETYVTFNKEVMEHLFNGGQIVFAKSDKYAHSVLIRMPKDRFVNDDRNGQEDNKFEYVFAQNYSKDNVIDVDSYYNGNLKSLKSKCSLQHTDLRYRNKNR